MEAECSEESSIIQAAKSGLGTDRRTKSEERRRWVGQRGALCMSAARR